MPDLKMKTSVVANTAKEIRTLNDKINEDFDALQNRIKQLDRSWDGEAAYVALNKFSTLRSNYRKSRYTVVDNYVAFLYNQIGEGYTQTEDVNEKIADQLAAQFK